MPERRYSNGTWVTDSLGYFDGLIGVIRDAEIRHIEFEPEPLEVWVYFVELSPGIIREIAERWLVETEHPFSRGMAI